MAYTMRFICVSSKTMQKCFICFCKRQPVFFFIIFFSLIFFLHMYNFFFILHVYIYECILFERLIVINIISYYIHYIPLFMLNSKAADTLDYVRSHLIRVRGMPNTLQAGNKFRDNSLQSRVIFRGQTHGVKKIELVVERGAVMLSYWESILHNIPRYLLSHSLYVKNS